MDFVNAFVAIELIQAKELILLKVTMAKNV